MLLTFNCTISGLKSLLRGSVPFTASSSHSSLTVPDTTQHSVFITAGFTPVLNEWVCDAGHDMSH